jgi:methylenetetrahydrofolate reductase (NADPH)
MGVDVLMNMTCTFMIREKMLERLDAAQNKGIRNILALRGDSPRGASDWVHNENGFNYAIDLVRFIRETYGDYFTICVAGYPEVHLTASSREDDIRHLKEKVDAGADFIITQLFYDNAIFYQWVKDCRAAGIKVPIIPGIMPILGYDRFKRMCKFTKTIVPPEITESLELIKHDDQLVQDYGVKQCIQQTQNLIANGYRFVHYYTMNLETAVLKVIDGNGTLNVHRSLPRSLSNNRADESCRPIFWSNNSKSYVAKTQNWDDFPNGRWGSNRSPAFMLELDDGFQSFAHKASGSSDEKRKLWVRLSKTSTKSVKLSLRSSQRKLKSSRSPKGR